MTALGSTLRILSLTTELLFVGSFWEIVSYVPSVVLTSLQQVAANLCNTWFWLILVCQKTKQIHRNMRKGFIWKRAEKEVQNRNRVGGENCLVCSMYPVKLSKNRFT